MAMVTPGGLVPVAVGVKVGVGGGGVVEIPVGEGVAVIVGVEEGRRVTGRIDTWPWVNIPSTEVP
jgi:hypothetical protein